jgi:glucose-1-phosphate adenylyltransferase
MATLSNPSLLAKFRSQTHFKASHSVDMNRVGCIILGGGQGTRLYPLTATRCKPAIYFGGRYRLIDVPVSNSLNSNCNKIYIITQFLSSSLHRHIFQTYHMDTFSNRFIDILTAEQKHNTKAWYEGTADAVRQNLEYFIETPADYFLILSGDQLYNFDFKEMVGFAMEKDADLVIATIPVAESDAKRMGILKIDETNRITDFYEKPQEKAVLEQLKVDDSILENAGVEPSSQRQYLGSMGIYLFKRQALFDLLQEDPREDFGKHLIPTKLRQKGGLYSYMYNGYWEDIGTIESFYQANMALTQPNPAFDCYSESNPIFTSRYNLPGPKISNTQIKDSIICEGSIIEADEVTNTILGPRTVMKKGSIIRESYLMGNDYYQTPIQNHQHFPEELTIGENCIIKKTIIDKNVHIGNGVQLINKNKLQEYNGEGICIRDGIIVVMRSADIPDGFIL